MTLCAITSVFNFFDDGRFYRNHERMAATLPIPLITVEMCLPHQQYRIPGSIRVRGGSMLWLKENLWNIALSHLPDDCTGVVALDAGVEIESEDWPNAVEEMLRSDPVLQPFSIVEWLSPDNEALREEPSFCAEPLALRNATGLAWAYRRPFLESVGGFLDCFVCGMNDCYMAQELLWPTRGHPPELGKRAREWGAKARGLGAMPAFLPGRLKHYWHGSDEGRVWDRIINVLSRRWFDPAHDLLKNEDGVYELTDRIPVMRREIAAFFKARHEAMAA